MGRLWGFRCGSCKAEFLAQGRSEGPPGRADWIPPVLCCGEPLRRLEADQVLSSIQTRRRRIARCPRCGYEVAIVVHPAGSLVCSVCQTDFMIVGGSPVTVTG